MIELNKNSWHFRMAKRCSNRYNYYGYNSSAASLCQYAKDVFLGTVGFLCAWFCLAFASLGTIMQIVFSVQHGVLLHAPLEGSGFVGMLLGIGFFTCLVAMIVGLLLAALFILGKTVEAVGNAVEDVKPPSILVEAYKGFKGKYCPTVSFTE